MRIKRAVRAGRRLAQGGAYALIMIALCSCHKQINSSDQESDEWCRVAVITGPGGKGIGPADFNASYLGVIAPVKPGERAVFQAHFPHARYMGLMLYDQDFRAIDAIRDYEVVPAQGVNPFVPGVSRSSEDLGEFEITVLMDDPPAGPRPANTMYAGRAQDGTPNRTVVLAYRIYLADQGLGFKDSHPLSVYGGVPGPHFLLRDKNGAAYCPDKVSTQWRRARIMGSILWANKELLANPYEVISKAQNPPVWVNSYSRENRRDNTVVGNDDTIYLETPVSRQFGELLVLRWRAADTPVETFYGAPFPPAPDMRYYSLSFAYVKFADVSKVVTEKTVADVEVPVLPDGTRQLVIGFKGMARPEVVPAEQWVGLAQERGIIVMRNIMIRAGYEGDLGWLPAGEIKGEEDKFTPGGVYCSVEEFTQNPDLGLERRL